MVQKRRRREQPKSHTEWIQDIGLEPPGDFEECGTAVMVYKLVEMYTDPNISLRVRYALSRSATRTGLRSGKVD